MGKQVMHYSYWEEVNRGVIRMAGAVVHTSDFVSACRCYVSTGERMAGAGEEHRVTCKHCLRCIERDNGGPPDAAEDEEVSDV